MQTTDYPAIYQAADAASLGGQQAFLRTVRLRLGGYTTASIGGAFSWLVAGWDLWGVLAAIGFIVALSAEVYSIRAKPDRTWYEGRAAAESAKTLTWRYMVGGEPFQMEQTEAQADSQFAEGIRGVLTDLDELSIPPVEAATHQITPEMRENRKKSLAERKVLYDEGRIEDQRAWYASKATHNHRRAKAFETASIVLQFAGLVAAVLKAFGSPQVDLLGIVSAASAAILSWAQARQYRSLASAYSVAAQELTSIRSIIHQDRSEEEWARFVDESEEAISREHTLWRASRGVTG